jgi:hypothetical protein
LGKDDGYVQNTKWKDENAVKWNEAGKKMEKLEMKKWGGWMDEWNEAKNKIKNNANYYRVIEKNFMRATLIDPMWVEFGKITAELKFFTEKTSNI